jgi:hypothetical protein
MKSNIIFQKDNQLYLDKSKLDENTLNAIVDLSEDFKNTMTYSFPAIEYHIATNKIIYNLNTNGDISSFNMILRNTYKFVKTIKSYTLNDIIIYNMLFHKIRQDSGAIRDAVNNEKYGAPLDLYSVDFMKEVEIDNPITDFSNF